MKGPIAQATLRTSAVLFLRLLVQACTLLLVARLLGPHDFGVFAGVVALAVVMGALSTLGTHFVLLAEVSDDPRKRWATLPFAIPTTLLCGSVLMTVYLFITPALIGYDQLTAGVLLTLGSAELLLQPLLLFPVSEQQGYGRIARSQILLLLPLVLRLVAASSVWFFNPGKPLETYAFGYVAASICALAIATFGFRYQWPAPRLWRLPKKSDAWRGASFAVMNLTALGPAELDKTLALKLLPLGPAGVYAAGARVVGALTLPVVAMMLAAIPRLFREGQHEHQRTARLLRWTFGSAAAYGLALAGALWMVAPVLEWLFGSKYQHIGTVVRWLCPAVPAIATRIVAGSTLMTLGRPWVRVTFEIIGLIVLALAATLLTALFRLPGMVLALVCSEWVMALLGSVLVVVIRSRDQSKAGV